MNQDQYAQSVESLSYELSLRQARRVLIAIRDDTKNLSEAKILAESIVGKKEKKNNNAKV